MISLHVPDTEQTKLMLGASELNRIKSTAVVINAARGQVVDHEALAESISEKRIKGAAIDVFPEEPRSADQPFDSCLRNLDNVILTPHIGGSTIEAQANIGREVAEKLIRYSDHGESMSAVNFPQVALPSFPGQHRLLHIHKNRPGVLSAINSLFSKNQINIRGQYLQTNEQVGYVVIDVDREYSELAQEKLREIEGTIRCRVLW